MRPLSLDSVPVVPICSAPPATISPAPLFALPAWMLKLPCDCSSAALRFVSTPLVVTLSAASLAPAAWTVPASLVSVDAVMSSLRCARIRLPELVRACSTSRLRSWPALTTPPPVVLAVLVRLCAAMLASCAAKIVPPALLTTPVLTRLSVLALTTPPVLSVLAVARVAVPPLPRVPAWLVSAPVLTLRACEPTTRPAVLLVAAWLCCCLPIVMPAPAPNMPFLVLDEPLLVLLVCSAAVTVRVSLGVYAHAVAGNDRAALDRGIMSGLYEDRTASDAAAFDLRALAQAGVVLVVLLSRLPPL